MKSITDYFNRQSVSDTTRTNSKRKASAGFTIVETLIVLAIAGLILLIVFEAIPQLERSSRNNQRKQDIQTILEAVSNYELDDSANFPSACGIGGSPPLCDHPGGGPNPNDYFMQYAENRLTIYQPSDISSNPQTTTDRANQPALTAPDDTQIVEIFNYEVCSPTTLGAATIQGAGYSNIVALFALESGNSTTVIPQCEQLE